MSKDDMIYTYLMYTYMRICVYKNMYIKFKPKNKIIKFHSWQMPKYDVSQKHQNMIALTNKDYLVNFFDIIENNSSQSFILSEMTLKTIITVL